MVCDLLPRVLLFGNHNWTGPYVLSCFVALREKSLPFEMKVLDLEHGQQNEPAYTKTSLTSRVPTLVDGDFSLSESSAIVEYLVLPADSHARSRARQIMAWVRSDLLPLREERSTGYVFYPPGALSPLNPLSAEAERAASKVVSAATTLVPKGAGPLFGEWCVADTDLAMMLQRLVKTDYKLPAHVEEFARREWQRPAIQEFVLHERPGHYPH